MSYFYSEVVSIDKFHENFTFEEKVKFKWKVLLYGRHDCGP